MDPTPLDLSAASLESAAWIDRTIEGLSPAADLLSVGVVVGDRFGGCRFANRAWEDMTGQEEEEWTGAGWLDVIDRSNGRDTTTLVTASVSAGRSFHAEWPARRRSGEPLTLHVTVASAVGDLGSVHGFVATAIDVTEERESTERLMHSATHDPLTGLVNRSAFEDFVDQSIDRHRSEPGCLAAVIFVDLDGLHETNDRYGHEAGDRLLQLTAERLRHAIRPADIVARYGGDEFTVLCDDLKHHDEALSIARRIVQLAGNTEAGNAITLSVGVAVTDETHTTAEQLVRDADNAMYVAKDRKDSEPVVHEFRKRR